MPRLEPVKWNESSKRDFAGWLHSEKLCRYCGEQKPLADFGRRTDTCDGLEFYCKPCRYLMSRLSDLRNHARSAPKREPTSKVCPRCKELRDPCDFPKNKRNPDWLGTYCRACSRVNQRDSYRRTAAKRSAKSAAWRRANPGKVREYSARYQARKYGGQEPALGVVNDVFRSFNGLCAYCGGHGTELDHVRPLALGGLDVPSNLVLACRSCNAQKSDRPLLVFLLARVTHAAA